MRKPPYTDHLTFNDYWDYFLNNNNSDKEDAKFREKALKQTFYGPHYSKTNLAFNFFTPVTAPIALTALSVVTMSVALAWVFKSIVDLCHAPKKEGQTRSGEALKSIGFSGAMFLVALASALLIAFSPLIALASLTGSSIATLAEKCAKPALSA